MSADLSKKWSDSLEDNQNQKPHTAIVSQEFGKIITASSNDKDASEQNQFGILGKIDHDPQTILPYSHDLPPELLSDIFIRAIPIREIVADNDSTVTRGSDYKITFALSQVCSYWRTVALATPQIWSSIYVVRQNGLESSALMAFTKMFIERSTNVPLHITIILPKVCMSKMKANWWQRGRDDELEIDEPETDEPETDEPEMDESEIGEPESDAEESDPSICPLLYFIFSYAYRWKTAIIHFHDDNSLAFPLAKLDFPILESLKYKRTYDFGYPNAFASSYTFGNAPSLRHVILDGLGSNLRLPLRQIWDYDGFPRIEFIRPASSHLQVCVFRGPLIVAEYPPNTIVFPNLTSLGIINSHPSYAPRGAEEGTIFRWIATPVLENLNIHCSSKSKEAEASLLVAELHRTMLSCPSTTLQSISFHIGGMTEQDLQKLLYSTPCLTTLDICNTSASVFTCLRVNSLSESTEPLAPRLQSLTIHDFSHSDAAALWAVYDSRHSPLNTAQDDMKVGCLDITFSYRSFPACHQAQCRIVEYDGVDIKALGLKKILGWCSHLVKQFLLDLPEKEKRYSVRRGFQQRVLIRCFDSPLYIYIFRYLATSKVLDAW